MRSRLSTERRCRLLLGDARDILLARPGARAHTHVLWLGLAAFVYLLTLSASVGWYLIPSALLFALLAAIALFDIRYLLIPDGPLGGAFILGIGMLPLLSDGVSWSTRLAAAAAAWILLRSFAWGYERWRGFSGLGLGDANLFALAGLWLGPQGLAGCLLVAAVSGLVSAAVRWRERGGIQAREPLPFGPHLALGLWLSWTLGPLEGLTLL